MQTLTLARKGEVSEEEVDIYPLLAEGPSRNR
jgi:hypothetical protein